jgi:uncharacterized membrane protein YebE (DUF533 family)
VLAKVAWETCSGPGGLGGLLSGAGGGALAASALGLLLGNKSARKYRWPGLTYGGWRPWACWPTKPTATGRPARAQHRKPSRKPLTASRPVQVEQHSQAILKALVAAAKADGHIDDRERQLIEGELNKLNGDSACAGMAASRAEQTAGPGRSGRAASTPEIGGRNVHRQPDAGG